MQFASAHCRTKEGGTDYAMNTLKTIQTATAAHTRYLSSPAAATLPEKTQGFLFPPTQVPCNSHAAITMLLQHHVHIHAAITMRFASPGCRTPRRYRLRSKRSEPQPPHTHGTLHRRLQPLHHTEKHNVSCSGSSPKQTPCNSHAAIRMRFAASRV